MRSYDLDQKLISRELTEAILNEVIESVTITIVGESVIGRRKLLETLGGDGGEVSGEFRVLGENHRASRDKAVYQRLLSHRFQNP